MTATTAVRRLDPDDWQTIRELRLTALRTDPTAFLSTWEGERHHDPEYWRAWPRRGAGFGVWRQDRPAGMVGVAPSTEDSSRAVIFAMWVAPDARGSGAADALIAAAVSWAAEQGCASVGLEVAAGNARAERAYARNGFVVVDEPTLTQCGLAMRRPCG
jgi:RimJ/RimL family protein N-acetyltransferase